MVQSFLLKGFDFAWFLVLAFIRIVLLFPFVRCLVELCSLGVVYVVVFVFVIWGPGLADLFHFDGSMEQCSAFLLFQLAHTGRALVKVYTFLGLLGLVVFKLLFSVRQSGWCGILTKALGMADQILYSITIRAVELPATTGHGFRTFINGLNVRLKGALSLVVLTETGQIAGD